jgi:uncharacterized Ntn-hydrolase superfamily protein
MAKIRLRSSLLLLALLPAATLPGVAHATYSLVAVDRANQHVGGAGASCVGNLAVSVILGVAPKFGAIHAQAALNTDARDEGVSMLEDGKSPSEVIAAITSQSFDPGAANRQYGVVSLTQDGAGFTGSANPNSAKDAQGLIADFAYSVQGNTLTGDAVIDNAESAFTSDDACDMPERLMLALEAGASDGGGDNRCTPNGIPANSAFVRVVDENGDDVIFIEVTGKTSVSPLIELREKFEAWRAENPCPDEDTSSEEESSSQEESSGESSEESSSTSEGEESSESEESSTEEEMSTDGSETGSDASTEQSDETSHDDETTEESSDDDDSDDSLDSESSSSQDDESGQSSDDSSDDDDDDNEDEDTNSTSCAIDPNVSFGATLAALGFFGIGARRRRFRRR